MGGDDATDGRGGDADDAPTTGQRDAATVDGGDAATVGGGDVATVGGGDVTTAKDGDVAANESGEVATADESGDAAADESGDDFGASERVDPELLPAEIRDAVPDWDDPYLDRVSDRLMFHYDLEADYPLRGERWDLYGRMRVENQKQFVHPALNYANHESQEHLFARRASGVRVAELERLVALGHEVADERITAHEEHYGTDVTFVLVVDRIPDDVRAFVSGFRDRTLLKFGYYGHYDVNLIVVAPDRREHVASEAADVVQAFALWTDVETPDEGFLSRLARKFWE